VKPVETFISHRRTLLVVTRNEDESMVRRFLTAAPAHAVGTYWRYRFYTIQTSKGQFTPPYGFRDIDDTTVFLEMRMFSDLERAKEWATEHDVASQREGVTP
jgi:hypothetical protein